MINIALKNGTNVVMSINEFARWACLAEAFHFLEEKSEELGVDLDKLIKPMAIDTYIQERYEAMNHDVMVEHYLGRI